MPSSDATQPVPKRTPWNKGKLTGAKPPLRPKHVWSIRTKLQVEGRTRVIAADNPASFIDDTPTAKLVRQVLGAISEFDKAMTVAKLRGARERKRREVGKCEGRKSHAELRPELVALAKRLRRQKPKGGRMSLRAISTELAWRGFLNENGCPFAAASVKSMLD